MERIKISVEVTVNKNIDEVWANWTLPEHITKWNFASDDWQCPSAQNDLRAGGRFSSRMEAKDGSFGFDFGGIYDEVIHLQKIAYTMEDGRQVETSFVSNGNSTTINTLFDAEDQNPIELQKGGWQAIINNFKKYCENN